jgi:hypothetical protein
MPLQTAATELPLQIQIVAQWLCKGGRRRTEARHLVKNVSMSLNLHLLTELTGNAGR